MRRTPTQRERAEARRAARRHFADDYLRRHPRCEIGPVLAAAGAIEARDCREWATDVHEPLKRSRGGSITSDSNSLACCRPCHDFTEREVARSTALGLLVPSWAAPTKETTDALPL